MGFFTVTMLRDLSVWTLCRTVFMNGVNIKKKSIPLGDITPRDLLSFCVSNIRCRSHGSGKFRISAIARIWQSSLCYILST